MSSTTVNPVSVAKSIPPPPQCFPVHGGTDAGFSTPAWQGWFALLAQAVSNASNVVAVDVATQFPPGIQPVNSLPATGAYNGQTVYLTTASGGNQPGLYTWNSALGVWLSAVNPQSTWILQGVQQLSSTGGLLVGNVTWNPSTGVVTGGTGGVVITKNGIAGFNGTSTTFAIDTHGNAQFGGTLVGAIVTAGNINVTSLSAINANMGTVTAGTFQTGTSGNHMIMSSLTNDFQIFDGSGNQVVWLQGNPGTAPAANFSLVQNVVSSACQCICSSTAANASALFATSSTAAYGAQIANSGTGVALQVQGNATSTALQIKNHGNTAMTIDGQVTMTAGGGAFFSTNVVPLANNTYTLGTASVGWQNIYANNAVTVISDRRSKKHIKDSDLGLEFIKKLRPRTYKIKKGQRRHHGFIAQEVKQALDECGVDSAIWTQADVEDALSQQALRYEEIIAPLVRAVQELDAKVEALSERRS